MRINDRHYRTIWLSPDDPTLVQTFDQRYLPHKLVVEDLRSLDAAARAIRDMHVRGAPLIGATAAFGMYLAVLHAPAAEWLHQLQLAAELLNATRPTAVDLFHATAGSLLAASYAESHDEAVAACLTYALQWTDDSAEQCRRIGRHGLPLLREISERKNGEPVNVLTHCNAGWLACIDYGTATAPIYAAHAEGIPVHVWVDETRPRLQGARITAYELAQEGVPHTVIVDNAGGHLMQHGLVDLVIVGTDRTTRQGDVANKIGTYLKALAAHDNGVPFYVALPSTSIDWQVRDGLREIPIEERNEAEVHFIDGANRDGQWQEVRITPSSSRGSNYGFDVTPARLVTELITERGICEASEAGLVGLFPEGVSRGAGDWVSG